MIRCAVRRARGVFQGPVIRELKVAAERVIDWGRIIPLDRPTNNASACSLE